MNKTIFNNILAALALTLAALATPSALAVVAVVAAAVSALLFYLVELAILGKKH